MSTFEELGALASDTPRKGTEVKRPSVPIISVPTSLSGGEYSDLAGGTHDKTRRKHMFTAPCTGPALVVLDAELTQTTPASVWLSTGIRAVDHCVETMCSLQSTAAADKDAGAGLKLLVSGLLRCKHDGEDVEARHQCQVGVIEAMKAVSTGVPMGGSHAIGHQLGPLGVGHGETSCILLPAVCEYNAEHGANVDRQRNVVEVLWKDQEVKGVLRERGLVEGKADLGQVLDAVIQELGMPRSLKDVGVGRDKVDELAANSLHDPWCATNAVPLEKKEQVLEILEMVLGG